MVVTARLPPHPPGPPILGNFIAFQRDPFTLFTEATRTYGDVVGINIGPMKSVVLSHPEHVKHVLVDHARNYRKSVVMERLKVMLGNGLLTSEGDFWKRQRRISQPAFNRQNIRAL